MVEVAVALVVVSILDDWKELRAAVVEVVVEGV